MKTTVIIHGHFYQPPRENPFTGIIQDQTSASPHTNWNEAIYMTCYRPNAYSRYLSPDGRIEKISNNYNNISCNFGPTLLKWIDQEHPDFINKLVQADKYSMKKLGHSNIIAQSYNHTILPLAEKKDRRIQIEWAIADYQSRFGHMPEGFWCPECAINADVIDNLAEAQIKFVILSPYQAASINGIPLNGAPAPFDRPFVIKGKKKSISVFFYDGDMASGISFGHYLKDADALYNKLLEKKKNYRNPALIHWATDGEIYGHHEAFGDMALAALIKKIEDKNDFEISNYGSYLETHPAEEEAELWNGNDGLGSSWSCCHGVGRWYTDCGCHTGGDNSWNQKWRTPMRKAFSSLEKKASAVFDSKIKKILGPDADSTEIIIRYGSVLCAKESLNDFILSLKKDLSRDEIKQIAVLLDAEKNLQFMFTSCGWFFNDISGIEPKQNITYACFAAKVFQQFSDEGLLKKLFSGLKAATSNVKQYGTGKDIAEAVMITDDPFFEIAGFFIMSINLAPDDEKKKTYGYFSLVSYSDDAITLRNDNTLEERSFTYRWIWEDKSLEISDTESCISFRYKKNDASLNSMRYFKSWISSSLSSCIDEKTLLSVSETLNSYMILLDNDNPGSDDILYENVGICIKALKCIKEIPSDWDDTKLFLTRLIRFVKLCGKKEDILRLNDALSKRLKSITDKISINENIPENSSELLDLVKLTHEEELRPDITEAQDVLYPFLFEKENAIDSDITCKLKQQLNFIY